MDTADLDGDYEWRGRGTVALCITVEKEFGIVWDEHAEEEDEHDVKEENSVKSELDSFWNHFAWIGSFSYCYTNEFCTQEGEDGSSESRPDGEKSTRVSSYMMLESSLNCLST